MHRLRVGLDMFVLYLIKVERRGIFGMSCAVDAEVLSWYNILIELCYENRNKKTNQGERWHEQAEKSSVSHYA